MRGKLAAGVIATFVASTASAQETQVSPDIKMKAQGLIYEDVSPFTKDWAVVKKGADPSQVAEQLEPAGWSKIDVLKALQPGGTYDVLVSAVGPGKITFMAVPSFESPAAAPVQFGLPSFGTIQPTEPWPVENVSFQEIKDEAVEKLQAGVDAVCSMPGRPSTLRVMVTVKFLEIEATWNASEVCKTP